VAAPDRQTLIHRTRALDRALLWNHYVVPHWHINYFRLGYWDKFSRPKVTPKYSLGFFNWWVDDAKEAQLREAGAPLKSLN
jgi:microcin C transport system substrate-binding protein